MKKNKFSRRSAVKGVFLGSCFPLLTSSIYPEISDRSAPKNIPDHFPNIDPEIAAEVVGKSHSNLEGVKALVDKRPELARATWEWRFGDWESAIGAASHVGRRDIVHYLLEKGARPTIFTFAMLGVYPVVKALIEYFPGIQTTLGPHGISLLRHAQAGLRMKDTLSAKQLDMQKQLIEHLESLGDANGPVYESVSEKDQQKYLGDYKYGPGAKDGFTVKINMQKLLSLAPIGGFGGSIYKIGEHLFTYNGAPSVTISFTVEGDAVQSLTVTEPDLRIKADKIS